MKHPFSSVSIITMLWLTAGLTFSCNKNKPKPGKAEVFIKFFGTAVTSYGYALEDTGDGYLLVGSSIQDGRLDKDVLVVNTDYFGNRRWQHHIGGSRNEIARDVMISAEGSIFIAGSKQQEHSDSSDFYVIQLSRDGLIQREFVYGEKKHSEEGYSIQLLSNDTLVVAGTVQKDDEQDMCVWKVKGSDIVWKRTVGILGEKEDLNQVIEGQSQELYWCGTAYRESGPSVDANIRIIKSDANGHMIWQYEYGKFDGIHQCGKQIMFAQDGYLYVVGSQGALGKPEEHLWFLKINQNGRMEWSKLPAGAGTGGTCLDQSQDGGFILAGYKSLAFSNPNPNENNSNFLLVKLNAEGDTEWYKDLGGSRHDEATSVIAANNGGYLMLGMADLYDNRNGVFALIKTNSKGEMNESEK
ncbi:MAG: hypothetical protein MUF42_01520 [Cytophagaceae bacterium]|jgi:hypothetical protein|nr:hypothetical protein [Cytophagaceae bacterium]